MSDPYHVRLSDEQYAEMSAWQLPDSIRQEMERRLREQLGSDPVYYLVRATAPWGEALNLYTFALPDPDAPTVTHTFQFSVLYGEGERFLDVVDLGYQRWERNPPPSDDDPMAPASN